MGIRKFSRVDDPCVLREQIKRLMLDYDQPVLVEEFCSGPEFTVGYSRNESAARVIGIMEIVPRRARLDEFIYSLEVKRNYLEEVEYHVPPNRPHPLLQA